MKPYFATLLLVFSINLFSQAPYYKMLGDTNRWYVSGYVIGVKPIGNQNVNNLESPCIGYYKANTDSVYNGVTYKKFIYESQFTGGFCSSMSGASLYSALVREDTIARKIYLIEDGTTVERLVMDFSLAVGNGMFLSLGTTFDDYYVVDSIISKSEILGLRKHFYLSGLNTPINTNTGNKYFIEWIESVGATHFPINQAFIDVPFSWGMDAACPRNQYNYFVTCKHTNNVKYYQDSCALDYAQNHASQGYLYFGNDCEYYAFSGGVKSVSFINNLELYPNPVIQNKLSIKFNALKLEPITVTIYNSLGQNVYTKQLYINTTENSFEINNFNLSQGIYSLHLKSENESSIMNFIKE